MLAGVQNANPTVAPTEPPPEVVPPVTDATVQLSVDGRIRSAGAVSLLPERYSKADAIFNLQRASLLVAAFAQGRLDLLKTAMQDRMHQPYRTEACPLLKQLLPLIEEPEIAGVALSGAGPSVLVFLAEGTTVLAAETRLQGLVGPEVELLPLRMAMGAKRIQL